MRKGEHMKKLHIMVILVIMALFVACAASNGGTAASTTDTGTKAPGTTTNTGTSSMASCIVGTHTIGNCKVN
jgi:hypothetical protein